MNLEDFKIINDKLYKHTIKVDKLLDFIYQELESVNYDDEYFVKESIEKVINKIEEIEEINYEE